MSLHPSFRTAIAEIIIISMLCFDIGTPLLVSAETEEIPTEITSENEISTASLSQTGGTLVIEDTGASSETGAINPPIESIDMSDTGVVISGATLTGEVFPEEIHTGSVVDTGSIIDTGSTNNTNLPKTNQPIRTANQLRLSQEENQRRDPSKEILVQFKEDRVKVESYVGQYQIDTIESAHNLETTDTLSEENIAVMKVQDISGDSIEQSMTSHVEEVFTSTGTEIAVEKAIEELKKDPRVAHVQKNFIYKIASYGDTYTGRIIPNDPEFSRLWGLDNQGHDVDGISGEIDADIDYPEAMAYASGKISSGVIVAILDTGIAENHLDINANLWNGSQCLSDTGAFLGGCEHGYDFAYEDKQPYDNGYITHGTHVAGTIGAIGNNNIGVVGVAPRVQMMVVKIFDDWGWTDTTSIIRGIHFASRNGAKVINASFGGISSVGDKQNFDFLTYDAIASFSGLFVAAAGNDGENFDSSGYKFFPSGFGSDTVVSGEQIISGETVYSGTEIIPGLINVISVAATNSHDNLASFSNYGTGSVHIAAPGEHIYSTYVKQIVSAEVSYVGYESGWMKQPGAPASSWGNRTISTVSGEANGFDFSKALWTNANTPYVSGEDSYIETTIPQGSEELNDFSLDYWCDTPISGFFNPRKDAIEVLISTGATFTSIYEADEGDMSYIGNLVEVDGHMGYKVENDFGGISRFYGAGNGPLKIRIRWHTDSEDDMENGSYHYGCAFGKTEIHRAHYDKSYDYLDGTSMATPHVAGAAALALSYRPDTPIQDLKSLIMSSGDYKMSLEGKIQSSARLNLVNLLRAVTVPTFIRQKYVLSGESAVKIYAEGKDAETAFAIISKTPNFYGTTGYYTYAATLAENHVIPPSLTETGYDLLSFMNRGEFAKMLLNLGGYTPTPCTGTIFADVNANMYGGTSLCSVIETLASAGAIPSSQANFYPTNMVLNQDYIEYILATLGYTGSLVNHGYNNIGMLPTRTQAFINRAFEVGCLAAPEYFSPNLTTTRGEVYAFTICVSGLKDTTDTRSLSISSEVFSGGLVFEGLTPDSDYYYRVGFYGNFYPDTQNETIYHFHTPKVVPITITNPITSTGGIVYLSGSTQTGVTFSGSSASGHIVLIDTGSSFKVDIPTRGLIINSSGSWDGTLHAPSVDTGGLVISTTGGFVPVTVVYQAGNPDVPLILSGQVATVTVVVPYANGNLVPIYRANSASSTYILIATCTVMNGQCTFTTNHFSFFALGMSQVPPNIPGAGPNIGGGGSSGPQVNSGSLYYGSLLLYSVPGFTVTSQKGETQNTTSSEKSPPQEALYTKESHFIRARKNYVMPFLDELNLEPDNMKKKTLCDVYIENLKSKKTISHDKEAQKELHAAVLQVQALKAKIVK